MAIPSTGKVSLGDMQTEFGGSNPISLSEYYRGGLYVPTSLTQVPVTGTPISIGIFRGSQKTLPLTITTFGTQVDQYGHSNGPYPWSYFLSDTGASNVNSNNLHFILVAGGGIPGATGSGTYTWTSQLILQRTPGPTNYIVEICDADKYAYTSYIDYNQDPPALVTDINTEIALPNPIKTASNSIKDIYIKGNQSGLINGYKITVSDGTASTSINLYVGLRW